MSNSCPLFKDTQGKAGNYKATPKVHLKKIKRKKETTYQIDYRVNGRRIRLTVGPNKHEAEHIRTDIQRDLLLGKFNLPTSQSTKIHLDKLIEEFLDEKRNRVRENSLKRYRNYLDRLKAYYKEYFPAPAADISLISHALHTKNETTKPWTAATINDSIKLIRSLFKFAIKKKYITKKPIRRY